MNCVENERSKRNKKERTYTIRVNGNKYRTGKMACDEFREAEFYTDNDWLNYLRTSGDYYVVE